MRSRGIAQLAIVTSIIAIGIIVLFWQVFALGHVQVPADIVYSDPVMREVAPPGYSAPRNPLLGDHIYQFYVWHTIAARAMQSTGKIPLWNPHFLAGQPLVANSQPALFYPVNLLLFLFDPATVATLRVFFNLLIASTFTYLFSRELGVSFFAACLASIAFTFSGAMMVGPGHAYANSLAWLPYIFWSGERLLNRPRVSASLVAGTGIGLTILGGHPETVLHNLLAATLYFSARNFFRASHTAIKLRHVSLFLIALAIGFALGAIQWIPFAALLSDSAVVTRSRSFTPDSMLYSSEWLANLALLVTLVYPNFFGNPADGTYYWIFPNFQNYLEQSMYVGLVPIALASGTMASASRKNPTTLILSALAILCLLIAFRAPGIEALNYLPLLDRANNTRLKWTFSFLAAVLAGIGMDRLERHQFARTKTSRRFWIGFSFVLTSAFAIATVIRVWKNWVIATGAPPDPNARRLLFEIFWLQQPRTVVSVIAILIALGSTFALWKRPKWAAKVKIMWIAITFIELVVINHGFNTTVPRNFIFPPTPLTAELQEDKELFRVIEVPGIFGPNYGAIYGISLVGGYDLPTWRLYSDVFTAQGGRGYRQTWSPGWPLVDWMNVKYVVTRRELTEVKYELARAGDGYRLYRNQNVLPRAFIVRKHQVISDAPAALKVLTSGAFDFRQRVILSQSPPPHLTATLGNEKLEVCYAVTITRYLNDLVELETACDEPGWLVMSDVIAPGWQAWLDNTRVDLYRANHAFRAVFTPAGRHTIRMEYHPIEFTIGAALSIATLTVLAVSMALAFLKGTTWHPTRSLRKRREKVTIHLRH